MVQPEPIGDFQFEDLQEGLSIRRPYCITPEVYSSFLASSGDQSPIHVDEAYARQAGYPGRVMHGTILNGFVSHFIGMVFPGRRSLLLSVDLRYLQPCYLQDEIVLEASIAQKLETHRVVVLNLRILRVSDQIIIANGRAQVMVRHA